LVYACEVDNSLKTMSFADLDALSNQVADSLRRPLTSGGLGLNVGDAAGICMPMSPEAVAIYIGIVKAGCAAVSIADSFSAKEIETRMRLSHAKALFTQDVVYRFAKNLPLFERVLHFGDFAHVVILPGRGSELHSSVVPLMRPDLDISWETFLKGTSTAFETVSCPADHICNILFSSGTTGEPKAIPWFHSTPIKCAVDGFLHQDIKVGEVVAWPTNLGWMMGPWLLFQMINGATIALFGGVTSTDLFCKFVENAKVSMLGVVPSLVKSWWTLNATEKCDWSCVRRFSSSGEASDPIAMQWLMSRANYAPVIEYCGGTEVAGSYLSSTMVQPNVPSMFSTPVLGNNFVIIDDNGKPVDQGEIALIPPALGLSSRLLNRDHNECYFDGMPAGPNGEVLRKHGDEIQRVNWLCGSAYNLPNQAFGAGKCAPNSAYYRALGRCDDTMNLGGIKVSSVEIERVCNEVPGVLETAAIAVSPAGGGPSRLILFAIVHADVQAEMTVDKLKPLLQQAIKTLLNPLFHVGEVVVAEKLPRTASNKVMRRVIRDEYLAAQSGKK
jgi:acetyl-CoA synthetase